MNPVFRKVLWRCTYLVSVALMPFAAFAQSFDPLAIFLTWQQDPTTTMTIDWHTLDADPPAGIMYRNEGTPDWTSAAGDAQPFPYSDRTIHRVELTGLTPATVYEFQFAAEGPVFRFRTMPATAATPVRFAVGGDTLSRKEWMDAMNSQAARHDIDFVVFGGDLAYANGDPRLVERWYWWFDSLTTHLRTNDNRLIPVIVAVGNHEVFGMRRLERDGATHLADEWGLREGDAPFFSKLFAFPGPPHYNVLDFGDYLSLILLDSNHTNLVMGSQTVWLEQTLSDREHVAHKFPVYHVPAYPSVRDFMGTTSANIRDHWAPLFERHGVRVAFEHHDHAYKRTPPIRAGAIDEDGVVYLGDGAWGVNTRDVHPAGETWYLERSEAVRHAIIVTVHNETQDYVMVDARGNVFDRYATSVEAPAAR